MGHTSFQLNRRAFLRSGLIAAGAIAFSPAFLRQAFASAPATPGDGPYGPLQAYDANGIALPAGFNSREIARGGSQVEGTTYAWHRATDGQATFATLGPGGVPDGGWILVANSELNTTGAGGVSGIEFGPDAAIERAYRVLQGTRANCAGGRTPWGTWISCEEHSNGKVWECDPTGGNPAGTARPAMGVFCHEAASVDPVNERIYLTEDQTDGCLYRFTPDSYPDLSSGLLEVARVDGPQHVTWAGVPEPAGGSLKPTRYQVATATHFDGGEGTWYHDGTVYFTTKGDNRVWAYDVAASALEVLYDAADIGPDAPLTGVDNIAVSAAGDIFICEDRQDHDICLITPDFHVSRFLKLNHDMHAGTPVGGNELTGVTFDPAGERMYLGAQRSFASGDASETPPGAVYEIRGRFRQTSPDMRAPDLSLRARKRLRIEKLLAHGLPISFDLSEPSGVKAVLRMSVRAADGTPHRRTLARAAPNVVLHDRVGLHLKPTRGAARLLEGRAHIKAKLEVTATDAAGNRMVNVRKLQLQRRPRSRAH